MKSNFILFLLLTLQLTFLKVNSQSFNWKYISNTNNIIVLETGFSNAVYYGIAYSHKFNTRVPLLITTNISIPFGEKLVDDFKTKVGGEILLLNRTSLKGSVSVHGIYRRHETSLVRLQNFGSEVRGVFGYYSKRSFVSAEIALDNAIVTHFKHSEKYRAEIYDDVVDGWYGPSTGSGFLFGLRTGYSFNKHDITLGLGRILGLDFETQPLIPVYLNLGLNFRGL